MATVVDSPVHHSGRPRSTACVREGTSCLAACVARRRGGTASLPFRDKAFPLDDAFVLSLAPDAGDLAALLQFASLAPFPSRSSAPAAPPRTKPPISPLGASSNHF